MSVSPAPQRLAPQRIEPTRIASPRRVAPESDKRIVPVYVGHSDAAGVRGAFLSRTASAVKPGELVAYYPAFCIDVGVWNGWVAERRLSPVAEAFWLTYLVPVYVHEAGRGGGGNPNYYAVPSSWFNLETQDPSLVLYLLNNCTELWSGDVQARPGAENPLSLFYTTHDADERVARALAGHFINEPSVDARHATANVVINGGVDVDDDRLDGHRFLSGVLLGVEAMTSIRPGQELLWCYGSQYERRGYMPPHRSQCGPAAMAMSA